MKRSVRGGLIQTSNPLNDTTLDLSEIRQAMVDKHLTLIDEAGKKDVQILCLQELFNTPYYCPSKDRRWLDLAESIPGPTTEMMAKIAALHRMVIIVPLCEKENDLYYNTAAVLDADGTYLGKYRKNHIPHIAGVVSLRGLLVCIKPPRTDRFITLSGYSLLFNLFVKQKQK